MESCSDEIQIAGFTFLSNFDSSNLGKVEIVPVKSAPTLPTIKHPEKKKPVAALVRTPGKPPSHSKLPPVVEVPDYEFNVWTKPDCCGTEFENANRTWFYFGIRGGQPFSLVKLNIINLNKQSRMYREGMAPVYRISPGRGWERVRDKPVYTVDDNVFTLSFKYRTLESPKATIFFAFTYPFSYVDLQQYLGAIDSRLCKMENRIPKMDSKFQKCVKISNENDDIIYYHRELACYSLDGRRVDLLTVSSYHNITTEREPRLPNLFPDVETLRPFKFMDKKVIFLSARVHPGETPSSFVLNGLLNLLVSRDDPIALLLRRQFVFKIIPMLNPDGVARGHYRTDTRGANLNRFYLQPSVLYHPSIYAARSLIRYYHNGAEEEDDSIHDEEVDPISQSEDTTSPDDVTSSTETLPLQGLSLKSSRSSLSSESMPSLSDPVPGGSPGSSKPQFVAGQGNENGSGILLYVDMHGHASKKGIFMYGNHFSTVEDCVECMLFPKLLSLNSQNFHFAGCNFTERNMYLRDKRDGSSREGSGRVAVLRLTGIVRSYTLECNYNTGRIVNILPTSSRELPGRPPPNLLTPPKYTPYVYEEIGRALGVSILDLTNSNPWTRIPNSEFHTIAGVREWLRLKTLSENFGYQRGTEAVPKVKRHSQVPMSLRPTKSKLKEHLASRCAPQAVSKLSEPSVVPSQSSKDVQLLPKRPPICSGIRLKAVKTSRVVDKSTKFKFVQEEIDSEKKVALSTVSIGLNCPDVSSKGKVLPPTDTCVFKQSSKRLKISKVDSDGLKSKKMGWKNEVGSDDATDAPLFSKVARPVPNLAHISSASEPLLLPMAKKRTLKPRTQLLPLKYKKTLEKRRNSDGPRKKTKTLYKKAGKLALSATDISNQERKRRKNLATEH